jgi:dipeptidyl aminopeptidase/acylaminoacyl peptidase
MRTCAFVMLVAALAGCEPDTQSTPVSESLENLQAVELPGFDDEYFIQFTATRDEYATARADERYTMEQFTYDSDGLTVGAYLYRPNSPPAEPSPVILFVRGSFTRDAAFPGEILVMSHRFAEAGYIVIAPHLRGSLGWKGVDELGGAELHDLVNILPQLPRIENADPRRVFLAGESRGGAEVYMALRDGFPARAAVVWGAFTDVEDLMRPESPQAAYTSNIWPDIDERRAEIVYTRSALEWAEQIRVPVLIMHGGDDEAIPPHHSARLDAALTRLGRVHEYILFEGEGHLIGGRSAERDAATVAWFRRYDAN